MMKAEYYEATLFPDGHLEVTFGRHSGPARTMVMKAPLDEWKAWFQGTTPLDDALPSLTQEQRQFLLSGVMPDSELKEDNQ